MPMIVATQEFPYGGKARFVGDEFEASEDDARILKSVGKAKDPAPKRTAVKTRAMKADPTEEKESDPGRYQRSDMRAQDE